MATPAHVTSLIQDAVVAAFRSGCEAADFRDAVAAVWEDQIHVELKKAHEAFGQTDTQGATDDGG